MIILKRCAREVDGYYDFTHMLLVYYKEKNNNRNASNDDVITSEKYVDNLTKNR